MQNFMFNEYYIYTPRNELAGKANAVSHGFTNTCTPIQERSVIKFAHSESISVSPE